MPVGVASMGLLCSAHAKLISLVSALFLISACLRAGRSVADRIVRNDEAAGATPAQSTIKSEL